MPLVNENYLLLRGAYLFPEIDRRVRAHAAAHPERAERIIKCGIGDVTEPLPAAVREAMHRAVDEMGDAATFRGYGPPTGYDFLREAIVTHDFGALGVTVDPDEAPGAVVRRTEPLAHVWEVASKLRQGGGEIRV